MLLLQTADPVPEIRRWIDALGSDDVDVRDRAFRSLQEKGESALPLIREALAVSDPEVRARCRALIRGIEFEPGARELAGVGVIVPDVRADPERMKEYERLVAAGKIDAILKEDHAWLTCAIAGLLSDRQPVAFGSLRVLRGIHSRRKIQDVGSGLADGLNLRAFRSAESRADEYAGWSQWWFTKAARDQVAGWERLPDPAVENWEETLRTLRGGAGFEDPTTAQHGLFRRVKGMGKAAYPFLIRSIDHEDGAIGNTAVEVLNKLTGMRSAGVTGETKGRVKEDWERWLNTEK
jgi:hypothetical protein